MGEVLLAHTSWPESPLAAVKRLRPDVARVHTFAERFRHEAELAVRLSHPNVVGTLGVGTVGHRLYVASELVLGRDVGRIADRLRQQGQGGPAAVGLRILIDALTGLAYVHSAKEIDGTPLELVHRDITPGNILIGYDGRARVADFGLAKSLLSEGSQLTKRGEILGTPHYLSPELVRGEEATPAADIYGLGAVLYRFFTGVAPFQGTTSEILSQVLSGKPRPLKEMRPDLPSWIISLINRMLNPAVEWRPDNAQALASEIIEVAQKHHMLIARTLIAQWLRRFFGPEYEQETAEHDRWMRTGPRVLDNAEEGMVIFARAAGMPALTTGRNEIEYTPTELGRSEFPGARHSRTPSMFVGSSESNPNEQTSVESPSSLRSVDRFQSISEKGPTLGWKRSTVLLVAFLTLGATVGVGVAQVVRRLRPLETRSVEGITLARVRLNRVHQRLERLRDSGVDVPAEAWRHLAAAAAALLDESVSLVNQHLDAVRTHILHLNKDTSLKVDSE